MEKFMEWLKKNMTMTVTVVALGALVTFGYAKGCNVTVEPAPAAEVTVVDGTGGTGGSGGIGGAAGDAE